MNILKAKAFACLMIHEGGKALPQAREQNQRADLERWVQQWKNFLHLSETGISASVLAQIMTAEEKTLTAFQEQAQQDLDDANAALVGSLGSVDLTAVLVRIKDAQDRLNRHFDNLLLLRDCLDAEINPRREGKSEVKSFTQQGSATPPSAPPPPSPAPTPEAPASVAEETPPAEDGPTDPTEALPPNLVICYKFASRSRPEKFFAVLDNLKQNARYNLFFVLATLDVDDASMNNEVVKTRLKQYPFVVPVFGNSKNKIDAVNRDLNHVNRDWHILVNLSDDMFFVQEGFDTRIIADMKYHFPDGDGALLYWDGGKETGDLMTMSIMGRPYYNRFGYIYHPSYESVYSDMEATEVARKLGRLKKIDGQPLIEHRHPAHNPALYPMDAQYQKTEHFEVHNRDKQTYKNREKAGFPTTI